MNEDQKKAAAERLAAAREKGLQRTHLLMLNTAKL